jgi:TonB family protein
MLDAQLTRVPITRTARVAVAAVLLTVTVPIAGLSLLAQARFATISGSMTDETGGLLRNVRMVLINSESQSKQEVRSNAAGIYEFVGVPAGEYQLEATLPGFETLKTAIAVGVGETRQHNIRMLLGSIEENIVVTNAPPPPPPPPPPPGAPPARREVARRSFGRCADPNVSGCIAPPVKLKDVRPIYPPNLRDGNVEGVVVFEGLLGTDGRLKDLRAVGSPHPDLERAARDAVNEWEFAPTILNGRTVDTRITINVTFRQP